MGIYEEHLGTSRTRAITPSGKDSVTRCNTSGKMGHILEGRAFGGDNYISEQQIVGVNMRAPLHRRNDRHAYVGYVFQNLNTFIVNLAPDAGIARVAPR